VRVRVRACTEAAATRPRKIDRRRKKIIVYVVRVCGLLALHFHREKRFFTFLSPLPPLTDGVVRMTKSLAVY